MDKVFSWVTVAAVFLFNLFLPLGGVLAKEPRDPHERAIVLEEMVVTATRDWEEIRKTPANVTVITTRQIEESGATTIPELLVQQESILFRDYTGNNGATSMIDMRGFGGDNPFGKVLILVDGVRMNPMDMSTFNWMQIPLQNVERIEIVRGAGSVMYGDTAIGGVVHIITKKGYGKPLFQMAVIAGSYGLHDERFSVSGSEGKLSYAGTFENRFSWGYRDRSKTDAQGGNINVGYDLSDKLNLSFGAAWNNNVYELPGELTKTQRDADRTKASNPNDDQKDIGLKFFGRIEAKCGPFGSFDLAVQYAGRDRRANMDSWSQWSYTNDQTLLLSPRYFLEKDVLGHTNKLTVGLDYYYQPYKKEFYKSRESSVRDQLAEFLRSGVGVYIRDEFSVLKQLILHGGYRLESATIGGSYTDWATPANSFAYSEKRHTAEVWEMGLTWLVGKKSKIFAKYGTVFRIPFLDEIASYNGFGAGSFNRNLDKEKGASMEVGAQYSPIDDLRIGVTIYRIDLKEEIQWVATGVSTGENRNVASTRHEGIEMSLDYRLKKWARLYGNATYQRATYEDGEYNKKEMFLVPNRMAYLALDLYLPWDITVRPEMRHVSERYLSQDFKNTAEKLEAYTTFGLSLFYRPVIGRLHVTAFFAIDNLTDVKYDSFGSDNSSWGGASTYYPMPGVTYRGGLSISF